MNKRRKLEWNIIPNNPMHLSLKVLSSALLAEKGKVHFSMAQERNVLFTRKNFYKKKGELT